jgi:hypothetical protein
MIPYREERLVRASVPILAETAASGRQRHKTLVALAAPQGRLPAASQTFAQPGHNAPDA